MATLPKETTQPKPDTKEAANVDEKPFAKPYPFKETPKVDKDTPLSGSFSFSKRGTSADNSSTLPKPLPFGYTPNVDKSTAPPKFFSFANPASGSASNSTFKPTIKFSAPLNNVYWRYSVKPCVGLCLLPSCSDDAASTEKRIHLLRDVIERGGSLARATGWKAAGDEDDLESRWVCSNLTPSEISRYIAWQESGSCPPVRWSDAGEDKIDEKKESKDWISIAAALNTLYPSQFVTRTQAYWFAQTQLHAMPLVQAIAKLQQAGLIFVCEEALWISPDKAEVQTARMIVSAATASLKATPNVPEVISRSIRRSIRFINARKWALESKVIEIEDRLRKDIAKKESA
jgi:hypothetical protein